MYDIIVPSDTTKVLRQYASRHNRYLEMGRIHAGWEEWKLQWHRARR